MSCSGNSMVKNNQPAVNGSKMNGSMNIRVAQVKSANGEQNMPSMYMPIKALNTFSRDWKI